MIIFKHTLSFLTLLLCHQFSCFHLRLSLVSLSTLFNEYVNMCTGITVMDGLLDYPGAQAAIKPKRVHPYTYIN